MMATPLISRALLDPRSVLELSLRQWDLLVRQGRRANLLARLARVLENAGLLPLIPDAPRLHLRSAVMMNEQQINLTRWELECIQQALHKLEVPVVLLKGAAYLAAKLPVALGRSFSDVDILVPKQQIGSVESQLMIHGWVGTHHDPYDQKYYRQWMHEIPPLSHSRRNTTIDVHHSILPETARIKVRAELLFDRIVPVPGLDGLFVLHPIDMVLHSATHLFHEGEFDNGLRDLFDLDGLFRHFGDTPDFWETLVSRALEVGVERPLFYAIRYTTRFFGTPVPLSIVNQSQCAKPSFLVLKTMDFCYARALRPDHDSCALAASALGRFALFLRSHWIRMPFHLLVSHLTRKALKRQKRPEPVPFVAKDGQG